MADYTITKNVGGASGFSGYSGATGSNGAAGTSGFSGYSGKSGYSGTNGNIWTSGTEGSFEFGSAGNNGDCYFATDTGAVWQKIAGTWIKVVASVIGSSGFSGYSGKSGFSGYSGVGTSGFSGYSGRSGYSGYSGSIGTSGFSGYSGYSGRSGFSGYSGVPAGSTLYFQYNNAGAFAGSPYVQYGDGTAGSDYSKLLLYTGGTGEDSAIALKSTRASTTQKWFFGSGDGGSNTNPFRIYDLTNSKEFIRIEPSSGQTTFLNGVIKLYGNSSTAPFYSKIVCLTAGSGEASAIGLESTYASTNQKWFFGSGDGNANTNDFNIYDLTASLKVFSIAVSTGKITTYGAMAPAALQTPTQATGSTPAGTPTAGTTIFDTSNNKLWIYNGSAWKSTTLA